MSLINVSNKDNVMFLNQNGVWRPIHRVSHNGQIRWRKASDAPTVSLNSRTQNSIRITVRNNDWGGTAYARRGTGAWQSKRIEEQLQTTFNFTGLAAGTSYSFQVYFIADEKKESITISQSYTTVAAPSKTVAPDVVLNSRTANSITIRVWNNDPIPASLYITGAGTSREDHLVPSGSSVLQTFSGLSSGTSYQFTAYAKAGTKDNSDTVTETFETVLVLSPPVVNASNIRFGAYPGPFMLIQNPNNFTVNCSWYTTGPGGTQDPRDWGSGTIAPGNSMMAMLDISKYTYGERVLWYVSIETQTSPVLRESVNGSVTMAY